MIQRIQSLYLLLTSLVSGGVVFIFDFWKTNENQVFNIVDAFAHQNYRFSGIGFIFVLTAILALASLFLFHKRKTQLILNRITILINLILFGILLFFLLNLSGETTVSEKGIGSFLPLVSIALLLLANRAIRKDENLVKSVDRLR